MFLYIRVAGTGEADTSALHFISDPDFFVLQNTAGTVEVWLRKRDAYPVTFCRQKDAHTYELGYGEHCTDHTTEYLYISIRNDGQIYIERDAYTVLPLFYTANKQHIVVSNEYHRIIGQANSLTVSKVGIQDLLAPFTDFQCPPFEEIHVVGERQILQWDGQTAKIIQPSPRSWALSDDALETDPKDFRRQLDRHFQHFFDTRLRDQAFAFQVSGGLDSATLPLFCHRKGLIHQPLMVTYGVPGKASTSQQQKLFTLTEALGATLSTVNINPQRDIPYLHLLSTTPPVPYYPEPSYISVLERDIALLQQAGISVLCNGIGGDEIFENITDTCVTHAYGEAELTRRQRMPRVGFLTDHFYTEYEASVPSEPAWILPLHARSMLGSQIAQNNLYIEAGIWPVSPFAYPSLYAYGQGLPVHFRANKNALRIYHAACGSPEIIYNSPKEADFDEAVDRPIRSGVYDPLVQVLSQNSVTAKMGYVDIDAFLHFYEAFKRSGMPRDYYRYFWMWLETEVSVLVGARAGVQL